MNQQKLSTQTLLSLVALLIVASIGLYASVAQNQLPVQPSNENETAGWQTYRNEKYGFEFMYPAIGKEQRIVENEEVGDVQIEYLSRDGKTYISDFIISISENKNKLSLQEWFIQIFDQCGGKILLDAGAYSEKTAPNNLDVLEPNNVPLPTEYFDADCGPRSDRYHILAPGKDFVITIHGPSQVTELDLFGYDTLEKQGVLFDQILSTFIFIEPVDNSVWQTYRNEEFGFEFKYPSNTKIEEWEGMVVIRNVEGPPSTEVMTETPFDYFIQFGKTSAQTIDEWFADAYANRGDLSPTKTPVSFNGYSAFAVSEPITLGGCDSEFIVTVYSGNLYRIQNPRCYTISDPRVSQTIEAINATFKLLEPIDASNWKTYRNVQYKFAIRYPDDWVPDPNSPPFPPELGLFIVYKPELGMASHGVGWVYPGELHLRLVKKDRPQDLPDRGVTYTEERLLFGQYSATKVISTQFPNGALGAFMPIAFAVIEHPDTLIVLEAKAYIDLKYEQPVLETFNRVFSTFDPN